MSGVKAASCATFFYGALAPRGQVDVAEGVFDTLSHVASEFSNNPPVNDTQTIGGPLYAHGWQMLLSQMGVVGNGGHGRCLYLGIGRKCVRLQGFSDDAGAVIRGYLNLHPLLFALLNGSGPRNLREWRFCADSLYEAFNFWQIPGLRNGGNGYCGQWIVRTVLVALMRWKGIAALELGVDDKVADLCGPDESGTLALLARITKCKDAQGCLRALMYKGPPELLAMWACLRREEVTGKKRRAQRKRAQDLGDVRGWFFVYKKRKFQTLNIFIKRNSGVSSSWRSASKVKVQKINMKNVLVFPACRSNNYRRQLSLEICSGAVDLENYGDCKLLSAMSREERKMLNHNTLKAYEIDALRGALHV